MIILSKYVFPASLACQIRASIRCGTELSYTALAGIFKNEIAYDAKIHKRYLYGFFEECSPSLIKKFMEEQKISRNQIIHVFNMLPDQGEKYKFRKALANGKF